MTDKLKRCPFCGGEASLIHGHASEQVWSHGNYSRVFCVRCQTRQLFHKDDQSAITAWNTRAIETELVEALRALTQWEGHRVYCGHGKDYDRPCVCGLNDAHDAARAAIKKATGE